MRCRRNAERAGAILVDDQLHRRHRLEPVVVHGREQRLGAEGVLDLVGDRAHLGAVRPHDPHLHRPADRRAEEQAIDLVADRGKVLGKDAAHLDDQPLARGHVLGDDEDLREVRVGELLVERQEEARGAFADIGGDEALIGIGQDSRLEGLCLRLDLGRAGAFREPEIDQDFRPRGLREEVLRDERERDDARGEGHERHGEHQSAPAHAPRDRRPEAPVEAGVVDVGVVAVPDVLALLQDRVAEPGREVDRREPGGDQGDADDVEERADILARRRGGEADRE